MNKIKQILSKTSEDVKVLIKRFPVSMLLIIFITIIASILIDQDFSKNIEKLLEKIYIFGIIWTIGTFFSETFFNKKLNKIISYVSTGGASLIFTYILLSEAPSDILQYKTSKILIAYIAILIALSIYKSIKNTDLSFEEYMLKAFRDLFNTTIIYIILSIGISIISTIFIELILDGKNTSAIQRLMVLLLGFYYVPSLIYTVSNINKKEVGSFVKGLVLYVLLPLIIIVFVIIYVYIAKIIILREMPENIIYRILTGIFIIAFPVWNMASNYSKNNKILSKIIKLLPYLYVPFILLEIYSMGVRINEFGITPLRYISCTFIIFQIIALALTFYKNKEKIIYIFLFASIIVFVVCASPLDFDNISNLSQKEIIKNNMPKGQEFENLTNDEKKKVKSAYKYLIKQIDGQKYIPEYLSDEDKESISEYNSKISNKNTKKYISLNKELKLNIEEYKNISYVEKKIENFDGILKFEDINKEINLEELVTELKKNKDISDDEVKQYFEATNIVKINDTEDFFISYMCIRYYNDSNSVEDLRVKGYVLEKY